MILGRQKLFSAKSKLLWAVSPGAYEGKEVAKYLYDNEEDYKKNRSKYAWLGHFTPATATATKMMLDDMAEKGATAKEMKKWLDDTNKNRIAAGIAEYVMGGATRGKSTMAAGMAARGKSIYDKAKGKRKTFKSESKSSKKTYRDEDDDD